MESLINLLAVCIEKTVENITEKQKEQLELAYKIATAIYKKDKDGIKKLFDLNDDEVDEILAHSKKIEERFLAITRKNGNE
jgi:SUMO ligase MMS21 Smc5/6 complex component